MLRSLSLALPLLLVASSARAQPPSAEERVAMQRAAETQGAFVDALAMQQRGDHEGAIRALDRMLQAGAVHPAIYDALAQSHTALGQHAEAFLAAEDAGRLAPDDPDILARLAGEQRRAGQREAAAATLERALRARPVSPSLLADLADVYTEAGMDTEAVGALERLVRVGDTPAARLRLAAYARQSGDLGAAVGHLDRAARLAPDEATIAVALADALADADRGTEAVSALDRFLSRRPGDVDALAARARLTGETPSASVRSPEDRLARARDAYESSAEDPVLLDEAEDLLSPLLSPDASAEALDLGGRVAFEQRRYAVAADRLLRALDADPRDAALWSFALRALARSADARAARMADDALLFFGADPEVQTAAAEALIASDRPADALEAAPDTPDGQALRALALVALDRLGDAEAALGLAEAASPLLFHAARGDLAAARGDSDTARAAWTQALGDDPEAAWVASRLG
ncbi:MAG: tetratricopeptide repeat protein [Bacteroidota bacterium]